MGRWHGELQEYFENRPLIGPLIRGYESNRLTTVGIDQPVTASYSPASNSTDDMGRGDVIESMHSLRDVRIAYRECNQKLLADSTMSGLKSTGGSSEQLIFSVLEFILFILTVHV